MASRKRKHRPAKAPVNTDDLEVPPPSPALFIQAYEADVRRGSQARLAAESLELATHGSGSSRTSGLIEWKSMSSDQSIWVDRYDARLLLDALPRVIAQQPPSPPSPSGWSDLPSDSEDTFFFTPEEADDYLREERLKARKAEDGEPEEEIWGGSDEEVTIPAQLEMRILANYGADKRFAFLRGRWKADSKGSTLVGLGNLAGYGDSDSDEDAEQCEPGPDTALVARQAPRQSMGRVAKSCEAGFMNRDLDV
ncbi:hypothetical protein C8F01DRAFT_1205653 [Mycena amicta]|nr:hypothetical protein C8F01DRAFT_1205653 [Mycena amicta]